MKSHIFYFLLVSALLMGCRAAKSPGPDPLSGTWSGHWGPSPERQSEVILELKWNGTKLQGTVNPRARAAPLTKTSFDPKSNAIAMELDFPIAGGGMDHYVIHGTVDGKTMRGTWTRHDGKGDFEITKDE